MLEHSAAEAAGCVRDADTLALPLGPGQPSGFLHALGKRERFERLQVFTALLVDWFALFTRPGVALHSGFFGPVERALRSAGHDVRFVPADFRRFEHIARHMAPRVMATAAAPPDPEGWCSLSLHAGATVAELRRCGRDPERCLIVEASPRQPRTLGLGSYRHALHVDEIDVLVPSDTPPTTLPEPDPDAVERAIARHALRYIPDAATLQTGIGAVPNAIAHLLAEGPGSGYGVHSELFSDGLMTLHRAGKVDDRAKGIYPGHSVCTFALGTRELYDWLDGEGRERVRFLPVSEVNDPAQIARNRNMVAINGAIAVDLAGQVVADHLHGRVYSGIGGHEDFVSGASFSEGGRSLICLPSTAKGSSRIVAEFDPGTCVTTPRHQVDVVITEHGAAELAGRTSDERREALIAIADPEQREALRDTQARD